MNSHPDSYGHCVLGARGKSSFSYSPLRKPWSFLVLFFVLRRSGGFPGAGFPPTVATTPLPSVRPRSFPLCLYDGIAIRVRFTGTPLFFLSPFFNRQAPPSRARCSVGVPLPLLLCNDSRFLRRPARDASTLTFCYSRQQPCPRLG